MEIEDVLPEDFSGHSKIELPLQDSNIVELERRRAELLEELNEVESHDSEKLNQRREDFPKQMEKKKSTKKMHSPSKSHTSVKLATEKPNFLIQKTNENQPVKKVDDPENFFKPLSVASSSSIKLSPTISSSFFKFGPSSSSKAFDLPYASNSAKQLTLPEVFTASSLPVSSSTSSNVFGQSSFPSSCLPAFSFQQPQVSFYFLNYFQSVCS